ncbi:MAG: site-specific integrase [Deltaproteobacteria bacterium]|nr:site-specific integrase [Deltaproteobacteria bacterium]
MPARKKSAISQVDGRILQRLSLLTGHASLRVQVGGRPGIQRVVWSDAEFREFQQEIEDSRAAHGLPPRGIDLGPEPPVARVLCALGLKRSTGWRLQIARTHPIQGEYWVLRHREHGSIGLGYVGEPLANVALLGIMVLALLGDAQSALSSPGRVAAALRDAQRTHPTLSPQAATAAVREEILDLLTRAAAVVLQAAESRKLRSQSDERLRATVMATLETALGEVQAPAPDYPAMTLREWYQHVWEPYRSQENPADWRTAESHWRIYILLGLGDVLMRDLDGPTVDRWRRGLTKQDGSPMSGNYHRSVSNSLKAALTEAERRGHIQQMPRFYPFKGSTKTVWKKEPLTIEELHALIEAASSPLHRALYATMAGLGSRPSEACRARWEHIDWSDPSIYVDGRKTDVATARVPLLDLPYRELREWWTICGRPAEGWAFPMAVARSRSRGRWSTFVYDPESPPISSAGSCKKGLAAAAKRAGIEKRVTPYSLRMDFATLSLEGGVQPHAVKRMMRHTAPSHTLARHYDRARATVAVDREALNDAFDSGSTE